jgi:hypothetical protein
MRTESHLLANLISVIITGIAAIENLSRNAL